MMTKPVEITLKIYHAELKEALQPWVDKELSSNLIIDTIVENKQNPISGDSHYFVVRLKKKDE